ncbi:ATP-binding protein involved in chromosome partitioning, partial [Candidatus Hakubella thermalkaliphila]
KTCPILSRTARSLTSLDRVGGRKMAEQYKTAFLGEIPLALSVREGGDSGVPVVVGYPHSPEAEAFRQAARNLAGQLSVQSYLLLPMV